LWRGFFFGAKPLQDEDRWLLASFAASALAAAALVYVSLQ
jgi:hypothetical protein